MPRPRSCYCNRIRLLSHFRKGAKSRLEPKSWVESQLHQGPVGGGRCPLIERVPPFTLTHQHRYGNLINYFLVAPSLNYANVSCSLNRRFDTLTCNAAVSISDYTHSLTVIAHRKLAAVLIFNSPFSLQSFHSLRYRVRIDKSSLNPKGLTSGIRFLYCSHLGSMGTVTDDLGSPHCCVSVLSWPSTGKLIYPRCTLSYYTPPSILPLLSLR